MNPVSTRERIEYDRFGPWTYSVTEPDEMPPRFDGWYEELKGSAMLLKLPIQAERRAVKPGSDLYEGLLAVGSGGIVHLSLSRGEVLRRDVAFAEISAVRLAQELLYGELIVDLADGGELTVAFNAVSADLMGEFVDAALRGCAARGARSSGGERSFAGAVGSAEPSEEDTLFQVLLRIQRRREPCLAALAYQPPCALKPAGKGRVLAGLVSSFLPWRLDGCLLAAAPSEIVLLVRGSGGPRRGWQRGYRYEVARIPASSFLGAEAEARSLADGACLHAVRLSAVGHDYELSFEKDPSAGLAGLSYSIGTMPSTMSSIRL